MVSVILSWLKFATKLSTEEAINLKFLIKQSSFFNSTSLPSSLIKEPTTTSLLKHWKCFPRLYRDSQWMDESHNQPSCQRWRIDYNLHCGLSLCHCWRQINPCKSSSVLHYWTRAYLHLWRSSSQQNPIPYEYFWGSPRAFKWTSEQHLHLCCQPYRWLALENKAYHQSRQCDSRTHKVCALTSICEAIKTTWHWGRRRGKHKPQRVLLLSDYDSWIWSQYSYLASRSWLPYFLSNTFRGVQAFLALEVIQTPEGIFFRFLIPRGLTGQWLSHAV